VQTPRLKGEGKNFGLFLSALKLQKLQRILIKKEEDKKKKCFKSQHFSPQPETFRFFIGVIIIYQYIITKDLNSSPFLGLVWLNNRSFWIM